MAPRRQDPRRLAVEAALQIEKGGYTNLVLNSLLRSSGLSGRDRAFCVRLAYGVQERRRTLDARLAPWLKRPLEKLDPVVRAVLRTGLYQMVYMDGVPPAAAVNESVGLTRQLGKSSAAGLVNAVLRRAGGPWAPTFRDPVEELGVTWSVSDGVAGLLLDCLGPAAREVLAASFVRPPLTVRVNRLRTTAAGLCSRLEKEGVKAAPAALPDSLQLTGAGEVAALAAFGQGLFHVQGLPSQLAALLVGAQPGERVLDLCAAPGGKSALLAQQMENTGSLFCCDLSGPRLSLVKEQLDRLGVCNAQLLQNDARRPNPQLAGMDRVLCDVPCSGLGVLAKKPDIRYKALDGLPGLIETQRQILAAGAAALKPGGRLVYSTCTLNPQENEGVVNGFLAENPAYRLLPPGPLLPPLPPAFGQQRQGMLFFLPDEGGTDGFFIASLERLW